MKLIIDIPKDLYAQIYSDAEIIIYGGMRSGKTLLATLLRSVRNGTPLDDVKAEIEANKWTDKNIRIERNALASGLEKAIEILDSIGKESEDK